MVSDGDTKIQGRLMCFLLAWVRNMKNHLKCNEIIVITKKRKYIYSIWGPERRLHKGGGCTKQSLAGWIGVHQGNEMKRAEQTDQKAWSEVTRRQTKKALPLDNLDSITKYLWRKEGKLQLQARSNNAGPSTPQAFPPHQSLDFVLGHFEAMHDCISISYTSFGNCVGNVVEELLILGSGGF